jgi:hypothetical protein
MKDIDTEYLKQWLIKTNEDIAVIVELSSEHPESYCSQSLFIHSKRLKSF